MLAGAGAAVTAGLNPDPDQARDWLAEELSQPEYNRPEPVIERVVSWLLERLGELISLVPGTTGLSQLLLVLVVLVAVAALLFALRGRLRQSALRDRAGGGVLDEPHLTSRDYRARGEAAWQRGDWDGALLDAYRALAVGAAERTLLDDVPGRTAHEVAVALQPAFPDRAEDLRDAADRFDDVRYGDRRATRDQAAAVSGLETALRRARPRLPVAR